VPENIILIGFGKLKLKDLLDRAEKSEQGMNELLAACMQHPPHYRTVTACSVAEQEDFVKYLEIMKDFAGDDLEGEKDER
jgi:hypothetical protein